MAQKRGEYSIAYRGLSLGSHTFEYSCNDTFFETMSGGEFTKGSCKVAFEAEVGANLIVINCEIEGELEVSCDRCLDELMLPIDFGGEIFVKFSQEVTDQVFDEANDTECDILWMNPSDDFIDLAQYIYESAVLSLPLKRVHGVDEEGQSLCNKDMLSRFTAASEEEDDDIFDELDDEDEDDGYNF